MCKHIFNQERRIYSNVNQKEVIENLYFEDRHKLTEISKILNVSVAYVSKILKQNERYEAEKQKRKEENLVKRRNIQKEMIYKNRKKKGQDLEYLALQKSHEQASKILSKRKTIGTEALRKWCSSAYKYDSFKKRYEFDAGKAARPVDLPKYIKI